MTDVGVARESGCLPVRRRGRAVWLVLAAVAVVASGCTPALRNEPAPTPNASASPRPSHLATRPDRAPTRAPDPVPAVDPHGPGIVGYVGCSVTRDAIKGYYLRGGARLWPFQGISYGGGSVAKWARAIGLPTGHWKDFEAMLAANPDTTAVWLQLCTSKDSPRDGAAEGIALIEELRRRMPAAAVYVSAQPDYTGHVCGISAEAGPSRMQELAAELVRDGYALAGPIVGPLTLDQTIDGCHANEEGMMLMGQQLLDFFGPEGTDGARAAAAPQDQGPGRPRPRTETPSAVGDGTSVSPAAAWDQAPST